MGITIVITTTTTMMIKITTKMTITTTTTMMKIMTMLIFDDAVDDIDNDDADDDGDGSEDASFGSHVYFLRGILNNLHEPALGRANKLHCACKPTIALSYALLLIITMIAKNMEMMMI